MATIVCHQGSQSCLESKPVEPRALRLTLSSTRSLESTSKSCSVKPEPSGWSVLEDLFDSPKLSNEIKGNEEIYVHPLEKRSLCGLSDKRLELCTENLGSETGSDDVLEDDFFLMSSSSTSSNRGDENVPMWRQLRGQKAARGDFPPPLTTMSGSESIRVRSHRENGRLVMEVEKAPSRNSVFQAERSNGRLRLYSTSIIEYENDINDENEEEEEEEEEIENGGVYMTEEEEEEEEEIGNGGVYMTEEEGGENSEIETTSFQRRNCGGGGGRWRCKGSEHGGFLGGGFIVDLPV